MIIDPKHNDSRLPKSIPDNKPYMSSKSNRFSLSESITSLSEDDKAKVDAKLDQLADSLQKIPFYPESIDRDAPHWYKEYIHNGSRLAWLFAISEDELDADDIAHEMASAHHLHQYSAYSENIEGRLRDVANLLHDTYPQVSWGVLWKLVRRFAVPIVQYASAVHCQFIDPTNQQCSAIIEEETIQDEWSEWESSISPPPEDSQCA